MATQRVFEGRVLGEVLQEASAKLGIAEADLDYRILEQGRRGLFGLGARRVRIEVMPPLRHMRETPAGDAGRGDAGSDSPPIPELDAVESTVGRMVGLMGLQLQATARASKGGIEVQLEGADARLLDQRDGELQSAFQFLLNRMARRTWPQAGRIRISRAGGLTQRDEELTEEIHRTAREVQQTGQTRRLQEMNAYERRLVHLTIRQYPGLGSRSEGNGQLKRVRVFKRREGGRRRNPRRRATPNG